MEMRASEFVMVSRKYAFAHRCNSNVPQGELETIIECRSKLSPMPSVGRNRLQASWAANPMVRGWWVFADEASLLTRTCATRTVLLCTSTYPSSPCMFASVKSRDGGSTYLVKTSWTYLSAWRHHDISKAGKRVVQRGYLPEGLPGRNSH